MVGKTRSSKRKNIEISPEPEKDKRTRSSTASKRKPDEEEEVKAATPKSQKKPKVESAKSPARTSKARVVKSAVKSPVKRAPKKTVVQVVEESDDESEAEEEPPLPAKRGRKPRQMDAYEVTSARSSVSRTHVTLVTEPSVASSASVRKPAYIPEVSIEAKELMTADSDRVRIEIGGIWQQYLAALVVCRNVMLPVFVAGMVYSYFGAKLSVTSAQSFANTGIMLMFTFCLVMGSYAIVLVPFIVIADALNRAFLHDGVNAVLYGRLALLAVALTLCGVYYGVYIQL